jgi:hypothetical protein
MNVTRIWCKYPGGTEHLINEISATSRFDSVANRDLHTYEGQEAVAYDIIQGWKSHGGKPIGTTFRIERADKLMMAGPTIDQTAAKADIYLGDW